MLTKRKGRVRERWVGWEWIARGEGKGERGRGYGGEEGGDGRRVQFKDGGGQEGKEGVDSRRWRVEMTARTEKKRKDPTCTSRADPW